MFWDPDRVFSLDISGDSTFIERFVRSMVPYQHTRLKSLTLHSYPYPSSLNERPVIRLPLQQMMSSHVTHLQHLSLSGISSDLSSLHGLRSLRLLLDNLTMHVDLQEIMLVLTRCPQLEALSIVLPLHFQPDTRVTSVDVPMIHRRNMVVQGTAQLCASLLQALATLPASAKIYAVTDSAAGSPAIPVLVSYLSDSTLR